jgi:thermitase
MGAGKRVAAGVCFLFAILLGGEAGAVLSVSQLQNPRVPGEFILRQRSQGQFGTLSVTGLQKTLGEVSILEVQPFRTDSRLYRVRLSDDGRLLETIRRLEGDSRFDLVEPNFIYRISDAGVPNDPQFSGLWHLSNQGQKDSQGNDGKIGADVRVLPAWAAGQTGSRKIVVAVIDTGIQWDHPDLKDNLFTNAGESGALAANGKDDDGNGFVDDTHGWNFADNKRNSSDDQGHGTHCAGSIGATGNNSTGVAGINWEVTLMPVKFLTASGSGTLQGAIESIQYATKMKVNVMSNSWGGGGFSQALMDAIQEARDAGILFVAAAGNDSNDNDAKPTYPASYELDNIVSVAALDNRDGIAGFSNYGKTKVHVAAPGVNILSTSMGSGYRTLSGTSMACPQVSGIAALMLSVDSSLAYSEIKRRLIRTSDPVASVRRKVVSRGRVNAYQAINNIEPPSNEPDPSAWVDVARTVESAHPYANNSNQVFTVSEPGVKFIRVVFSRIETEAKYDFVTIEDAAGGEQDKFTGTLGPVESEAVAGDSLKIRLRSDGSQTGFGFSVSKIQVIR